MSKTSVFLILAVIASVTLASQDCLENLGGQSNLIGKKVILDGVKSTLAVFNPDASEILQSTLPRRSRVVGPRQGMTMDYRPDRVNLLVDDDNVVTQAFCG